MYKAAVGVNCPPMHPFCRCKVTTPQQSEEDIQREIDERIDSWNIPEEMSLDEFIDRVNNGELEEIRAEQDPTLNSAKESEEEISDKNVDISEKSGIIEIESSKTEENNEICIEIDEFVPCLKDAKTGEILETEVRTLNPAEYSRYTEKNGWSIDWRKTPDDMSVLGVYIKGEAEPQGLISIRKDRGGVYLSNASTAPQNNKLLNNGRQKYVGVGGHLFAAAVKESVAAGNATGCVYGFAANEKLLNHYVEKFGALHTPIAHEYQFLIDGESAQKLIDTYNFERK